MVVDPLSVAMAHACTTASTAGSPRSLRDQTPPGPGSRVLEVEVFAKVAEVAVASGTGTWAAVVDSAVNSFAASYPTAAAILICPLDSFGHLLLTICSTSAADDSGGIPLIALITRPAYDKFLLDRLPRSFVTVLECPAGEAEWGRFTVTLLTRAGVLLARDGGSCPERLRPGTPHAVNSRLA